MNLIRQSAKDFAETHIKPMVMVWDEDQTFPLDLFKKLGEQGFMGILVPEQYQGLGMTNFALVSLTSKLAFIQRTWGHGRS